MKNILIQPYTFANTNTQPIVKQSSMTLFGVVSIGLLVVIFVCYIFRKNISSLTFMFSPQHISITVDVKNVRTKDFFRIKVTATIYVVVHSREFWQSNGSDDREVNSSLEKIFENAIKEAASNLNFLEIYQGRKKFREEIETSVQSIAESYLSIKSIIVGEINEEDNYDSTNYLDAKVAKHRTETIQSATLESRTQEAKTVPRILEQEQIIEEGKQQYKLSIRLKEMEVENNIKKHELNYDKESEFKVLELEKEIRNKELETQLEIESSELAFKESCLKNSQSFETAKIESEITIQQHIFDKDSELQYKIELQEIEQRKKLEIEESTSNKEVELILVENKAEIESKVREYQITSGKNRVDIEKEITSHQELSETELELLKLKEEMKVSEQDKQLKALQARLNQELETEKIERDIKFSSIEIDKLTQEKVVAEAVEAITTAIELATVRRENEKIQLRKERVADESEITQTLATAEEVRYKAVPESEVESVIKLVRDLVAANKLDVAEIAKALAPQEGVLGDSNIYTFAGGDGDINKLLRSTSGMQFIQSLIDGGLGKMLNPKQEKSTSQNKPKLWPF